MSKMSEYISRVVVDWLEERRSSFIRDQLRGPGSMIVVDPELVKLLDALERGRAARTTRFPDETENSENL